MKCGIIDCHSHILPGVDDGSTSVDESVAMLRLEVEQGIGCVLATPHFYAKWDDPEHFLEKRAAAFALLQRAHDRQPGLPQVIPGAEVFYYRGISESEWLPKLTISGGRAVLIEMPSAPWTDSMYLELKRIWEDRQIIPVIAHIDRYIRPFRTHHIPERLSELPVLVQANTQFFLRPTTSAMAMRLLKKDQIHLLGSDCHNLTDRQPNLKAVLGRVEAKLGQEVLSSICEYQKKILELY